MYSLFLKIWLGGSARRVPISGLLILALVPLTFVLQVSENMIEAISLRIIEAESYHVAVFYQETDIRPADTLDAVKSAMQEIEGVKAAYSEQRTGVIVAHGAVKKAALLRKIEPALFLEFDRNARIILLEGRLPRNTSEHSLQDNASVQESEKRQEIEQNAKHNTDHKAQREIIIARALAEELGVARGDTVRMVEAVSQKGVLPRISKAQVVGVFTTGYETLDKNWILGVYDGSGLVLSEYRTGLQVSDPFALPNNLVRASQSENMNIQEILQSVKARIPPNAYLSTWFEQNYGQFSLFVETKQFLFLIAFIAVFLAVVTLSSTMGIRLLDMHKSIAILQSMGLSRARFTFYLMITGLLYGIMSSCIASLIGIVLSWQVNTIIQTIDTVINRARLFFGYHSSVSILSKQVYLDYIPFSINVSSLLFVMICTILLCTVLALFPSRRLAKIQTIIVLRGTGR